MVRGTLAALIAGAALAVAGASPATAAPTLVIESPSNGSSTNDTTPTIRGTSTYALDQVTVAIHAGDTAEGAIVQAPTATPSPVEGDWSVTPTALTDGTYTAVAEQTELLLGESGSSAPVTFTIDTIAPAVTLDPVASPTNDSTPTLEGVPGTAAGDQPAVTVTIYKGSSVGGTVATSGGATLSGADWSYTTKQLVDGTYTAEATQGDAAGNTGKSEARTFVVKTAAPAVTLKPVPTPSNDATPTLEGGAGTAEGDEPEITIKIYAGGSVGGGAPVASGSTTAIGAAWSYTSSHLLDGTYTAQATWARARP